MPRSLHCTFDVVRTLASLSVLLLCPRLAAWAGQPPEIRAMAEQIVTQVAIGSDEEFFDAWNLDWPGMAKVKDAVEIGDYEAAKAALKEYFLQRREPVWKINHWDMPKEARGKAETHSSYASGEEILAHKFSAGGFDVDFGERDRVELFPADSSQRQPGHRVPGHPQHQPILPLEDARSALLVQPRREVCTRVRRRGYRSCTE